jgi:hypothetical protein
MRVRRDTIRVEESADCIGRLSLHRLPAERRRALCALGIRATPGFGRDEKRFAQDCVREPSNVHRRMNDRGGSQRPASSGYSSPLSLIREREENGCSA